MEINIKIMRNSQKLEEVKKNSVNLLKVFTERGNIKRKNVHEHVGE